MTDNNNSDSVSRREILRASGAAALAFGLAGCTGELDVGTTDNETTDDMGGETIPVLDVTARGIPQEKATALADALGVDGEFEVDEYGVLQYLDEEAYMPVPTADVDAEPELFNDEDGTQNREPMAINFEGLEEMPPPPNADELQAEFMAALEATEPLPAAPINVTTSTSHASIGIENAEDGTLELERDLDTAVYVRATYEDIPLEGPGAKIRGRASAIPGKEWSDVRHSFREVEEGTEVELMRPEEVVERYTEALTRQLDADEDGSGIEEIAPAEPRLVYRAPALRRETQNLVGEGTYEVQSLVPHYTVGATVTIEGPEGEPVEVDVLRELMPATRNEEYAPSLDLSASGAGNTYEASVEIDGGQPPYEVEWSLGDNVTVGTPSTGRTFSGEIQPREAINETTVTVDVTDANGVRVQRRTTIELDAEPVENLGVIKSASYGSDTGSDITNYSDAAASAVPGTADVGLEAAIWPSWSSGFLREANKNGTSRNNTWKGDSVWEKDFFAPKDNDWGVDTADLVFSSGHGFPRGWTVENTNHDGKWIWHTEADEDWGDLDLEWHALMSCNVLAPDDGNCGACNGQSRVDRWWQEFDGLHQFQGFQTLGYRTPGFPDAYGRYVFGNRLFGALKMRNAWFLAVDNYQPGYDPDQAWKRRGVVMWTADSDGRSGKDDYFHGKGPVGPDIPHSDVRWICWIVASTGGG